MGTAARIPDTQQSREREMDKLYWRDSYSWAMQQADVLRRRDFAGIDWENVIEEIEDLARSEARRLISQYVRIMEHFLKLQYREPGETDPVTGWVRTVNNARGEIDIVLHHNPGLKGRRDQLFAEAWPRSRNTAISAFVYHATEAIQSDSTLVREQKRLTREWSRLLPQENPYTLQQVETHFCLPERVRLTQRPQSRQQPAPKSDWSR